MPNILINPNSGIIEFSTGIAGTSTFDLGITGGNRVARLNYNNFGGLNLTSYVSNVTGVDRFTVDGANGRLFSVTDSLSGSLFSVNDIAGLPIIEAFDDNTVIMGEFNRNDFILSGNTLGLGAPPITGSNKLYVSGNTLIIGNLNVTGNIRMNGAPLITGIGGVDLSSYVTKTNGQFNDRPNVNGTGILLSGEAASLPDTIVYTTGDQTISGNKTFDVRPNVNGTGILLSGEAAALPDTIVYTTGDQTISGDKTFDIRPTVNGTGVLLIGETGINITNVIVTTNVTATGDNIVYQTGDQIISGNKTFTIRPTVNNTGILLSGDLNNQLDILGVNSIVYAISLG